MNYDNIKNLVGDFTFSYRHLFFIKTDSGNFEWSNPEYPDGDNTIKAFNGGYKEWYEHIGIPSGRSKGKHVIKDYCGEDVKFLDVH